MAGSVGFIGLGNMGGPMASNLAKHGFSLVVHDIDPAKVEPLRAQGATVADSAEAVAAATDPHHLHGGDDRAGRGGHRRASAASSRAPRPATSSCA